MSNSKSNKLSAFFSILCWFTVLLQLILILANRKASVFETLIRFFTFFTILTNILVAIVFTANWLQPKNSLQFFDKPNTKAAVAVYIFVVGFVYNTILRFIWLPKGWDKVADELLHLIIPIVYLVYWYFKFSKEFISRKTIYSWLIFPTVYIIVVMIRGSFSSYYPYPFLNIDTLGLQSVVLNALFMTLFFVIVSFSVVAINNFKINKIVD